MVLGDCHFLACSIIRPNLFYLFLFFSFPPTVAQLQRMVTQIGTPRDSTDLREKL